MPRAVDQSARRHVAARLERPLRGQHVAGDQEHAADIGLDARAQQKIVQRLARGDFARGDMGNRVEAGAPQRHRGLDVVAVVVAGQEGDGHIGAGGEIVSQLLHLMAAGGDFDRGGREKRSEVGGMHAGSGAVTG